MVSDLREMREHELKDLIMAAHRELGARDSQSPVGHLGKAVPSEAWPSAQGDVGAPFGSLISERLTLSNIDDAMKYQPWERAQAEAGEIVREALTLAAKAILRSVPDGAFRNVALRDVINARMNANAGISFRGRF